ncbi:hypothetical protein DFH29DRAFT_994865 [Suillus ampliporus]|nr:hypothetical protein DFH29DRAFT_994865 [Suillus ampliporus]
MFARFSNAFCALLGFVALLDVNASIIPAARNPDKRTNVVGAGNDPEPVFYFYADSVTRDLDLDKRTNVAGVGNNAEPDPDY